MGLAYGLFAPNAPFLIAPEQFGGVGRETVQRLRSLDVVSRIRPDVLVVASPHWVTSDRFLVHVGDRIPQIFDFSGFPPALHDVRYAPPGSPDLARSLVQAGASQGLPVSASSDWGLDHGAWAPLLHIAPGAATPVVPLSIAKLPASEHLRWGAVIGATLRKRPERCALIATGSITHSFARMDANAAQRWAEGERIEQEIVDLAVHGRVDELVDFDRRKWSLVEPEGDLGPLFILLGALGAGYTARRVGGVEQVYGAFGMSILEFIPHDRTMASP